MYKVDNYTLIKLLGKGAFGEVFLTSKDGTNELFATKKLKKTIVQNENVKKYFDNELFILQHISHPNILKFNEIKQTSNNYYIITDLCNGGDLSTCLKQYKKKHNGKPFPEKIVQFFMRQIVYALHYLHHKKIIHRDLKLENLLIHFEKEEDKENLNYLNSTVKIIDFGFARYLENNNLACSVLGSPMYMEPSILKKYSKMNENNSFGYDMSADIWSLGALCFELLVGVTPFQAQSINQLVAKVQVGSYKIPSELNLSKQSYSFLNCMLQSDPRLRADIDKLSEHEFLNLETEDFTPINKESESGNKYVQGSNFIMSINNPLKESFLNMFNNKAVIDEELLPQMPKEGCLPPPQVTPINEVPIKKEKKSLEITNELKDFINHAFDMMNKDTLHFEPVMIPIIPESNSKISSLEV